MTTKKDGKGKTVKITAKKAGRGKTVTVTAMSTDGTNRKANVKISENQDQMTAL
ncbi:MAG: VCBS domain-containing protein [Roseburia sp.]|nr:VCBS domain-containing protein [Roseburia sp.]